MDAIRDEKAIEAITYSEHHRLKMKSLMFTHVYIYMAERNITHLVSFHQIIKFEQGLNQNRNDLKAMRRHCFLSFESQVCPS
jgi:hypothetical protein